MIIFLAKSHKKIRAHVEVICPLTRITLRAEKALRVTWTALRDECTTIPQALSEDSW